MTDHLSQLRKSRYESKRDWWIVAIIWIGAAMMVFAAFDQFSSAAPFWLRATMLGVFLAVAAFMLWLLYSCNYSFSQDQLLIVCGPLRYRVPLAEINLVQPSRNPLSSPACSLDRLLIEWQGGNRRILISPEAKAEFLAELGRRCPQLILQGDRLISDKNR